MSENETTTSENVANNPSLDLIRVMETTLKNYNCMLKRIMRKSSFASFILAYYSVWLIIYSLTPLVFPNYFHNNLGVYMSIILSIIVLVYSLVNSNAHYSERISSLKKAIDDVKREKRHLSLKNDDLDDVRESYDKIIATTEYRSDVDFFSTVKIMCKEIGLSWFKIVIGVQKVDESINKKPIEYLRSLSPLLLQARIAFEYIWHAFLVIVPFVIFSMCIIAKVLNWLT